MPGICGIISRINTPEASRKVNMMATAMRHQPFYQSGFFSAPEFGVHAAWVAHPFAANRRFSNEQKDITILLAGECFVDAQVKMWLRQNGHSFSDSGEDCLVHLYEQWGDNFFVRLNGLFSGLLVDRRQRKVFLFNDRYGMERIYWHETKDAFYFASEAKALLRIERESRRFDEQGVAQFLTCGCPLEERTLFRGISLLPGGAAWSFEKGACVKHKYFSPETWEAQRPLSVEAFESAFQETFERILPRYIKSESRLGISLTAGLDTRMIMACVQKAGLNAICYTYSGRPGDTLDARLAARVAESCGLEHRVLRVGPDFIENFSAWADRTVFATDGCFGITGAHEVYLSGRARELSPVRLTGIFGGEVFRSVSTFKPIHLSAELLKPEMILLRDALLERARSLNENSVTFAAFKEIPLNMFGTVAACRSELCLRSPYLDNELVALAYRAPLSVRNSCDSAVRFVRNNSGVMGDIPTDMGYLGSSGLKAKLRRIAARLSFKLDYFNNEGLPSVLAPMNPMFWKMASATGIAGSHKYLHYRSWFRTGLAAYLNEALTDAQTRRSPFWNASFLNRMVTEHLSGRKNHTQEINAVLTLEAVDRLLFSNASYGGEDLTGDVIKEREPVPAN